MPDQKVPETSDERTTKRADQLEPGDWIHAKALGFKSQVHAVVPFTTRGLARVMVVHGETDLGEPDFNAFDADDMVPLLTDTELAQAEVAAARTKVAAELRALADLIEVHELPLPKYALQISFVHGGTADRAAREANLRMVAERLGLPIEHSYNKRHEVTWPKGRQSYEQGVIAEWSADFDPEPVADEPADEHMGRTTAVAEAKPDTLVVAHGSGPGRRNGAK